MSLHVRSANPVISKREVAINREFEIRCVLQDSFRKICRYIVNLFLIISLIVKFVIARDRIAYLITSVAIV